MSRTAIEDGGWFARDAAELFGEQTRFDGHNQVSVNADDQWAHEELYRTRKGIWILHWWSQWQGTCPTFRRVTPEVAMTWLIKNGHEDAAEKYTPEQLTSAEA